MFLSYLQTKDVHRQPFLHKTSLYNKDFCFAHIDDTVIFTSSHHLNESGAWETPRDDILRLDNCWFLLVSPCFHG